MFAKYIVPLSTAICALALMTGMQQCARATITVYAVNESDQPTAYVTWNGVQIASYGQPYYISDTTGVAYFSYDNFVPPSGFAPITCFRMQPGHTYTVTLKGSGSATAGSQQSLIVRVTSEQ